MPEQRRDKGGLGEKDLSPKPRPHDAGGPVQDAGAGAQRPPLGDWASGGRWPSRRDAAIVRPRQRASLPPDSRSAGPAHRLGSASGARAVVSPISGSAADAALCVVQFGGLESAGARAADDVQEAAISGTSPATRPGHGGPSAIGAPRLIAVADVAGDLGREALGGPGESLHRNDALGACRFIGVALISNVEEHHLDPVFADLSGPDPGTTARVAVVAHVGLLGGHCTVGSVGWVGRGRSGRGVTCSGREGRDDTPPAVESVGRSAGSLPGANRREREARWVWRNEPLRQSPGWMPGHHEGFRRGGATRPGGRGSSPRARRSAPGPGSTHHAFMNQKIMPMSPIRALVTGVGRPARKYQSRPRCVRIPGVSVALVR